MARQKGMLNLSGNIEVLAGAPFDARDIVPTKADLTVASNFPYPYVGMETYVTAEDKKYRYMGGDITDLSNWAEIGSGGGGQTYNDFTGATASTAGAHGLVPAPSAGDEGKVLFGNGEWGNIVMPSVDLSVLSNEAFILDTNEKAIGMASNRKLLYQRYVEKTTPNSSSLISLFSEQNLENCYFAGGYFVDANGYDVPINRYEDGVTDVGVSIKSDGTQMYFGVGSGSSGRPARFIIRYTKTTDSPLPAGVKFAGVTSAGEAIFKQTLTGLSVTTANDWFVITSSLSNVNKLIRGEYYSDATLYYPFSAQIINGTTLRLYGNIKTPQAQITSATIYYTLAS